MAAPKIGMKQLFGDAGQAQQIHHLRGQIEELEAEITQMRAGTLSSEEKAALEQQIEELTAQLSTTGGVHEISVSLIDPDLNQPRQTFPQFLIQERAESLRRQGQKTPIVVIPKNDGRYTLFDGELRWRAAPLIGWKTLKAVLIPQEEIVCEGEVFEGQLVTSIHFQKLHDLDLANALIRLIVHKYPNLKDREEDIPKILNTAFRRLQRQRKHLELAQVRVANLNTQQQWIETASFKEVEEQEIIATLLGLQLNPTTINNTVFPLLNLADDLKQTIKAEGLEASKARELNRLSVEQLQVDAVLALQIRIEATQKVIQENLSLSEVKTLVSQLISQYCQKLPSKPSRVVKLIKTIEQTKIEPAAQPEELETLRNALEKKLVEIQRILDSQ